MVGISFRCLDERKLQIKTLAEYWSGLCAELTSGVGMCQGMEWQMVKLKHRLVEQQRQKAEIRKPESAKWQTETRTGPEDRTSRLDPIQS
jgi:hypothetical protein